MVRRINALIVDDSPTTRKMVMSALRQTGLAEFNFTEADDGIDALAQYRAGQTQLLFVDMNMPRMNGLDFIRKLHAQHKQCPPAVMITGESSREKLMEALQETGLDAFLLKPVDRDRLRSGLKTLIDSIPETSGPSVVPNGECVPQAMQEMLGKACNLDLTPEPEDQSVRNGSIVLGMASLMGAVQWSVGLGFTRESAQAVASRFAGCEVPIDSPELGDAIGELTNIVCGRTKMLLSQRGLSADMSLPTVISASEYRMLVHRPGKTAIDHVHFNSPLGKFWTVVTVGLHAGMIL